MVLYRGMLPSCIENLSANRMPVTAKCCTAQSDGFNGLQQWLSKYPASGQLGCRSVELLEVLRWMQAPCRRNELSVPGFNELTEVLKCVGKSARTEVREVAERRDACLLSNRCCIVNKGVNAQPLKGVCFASPTQPFVNDFYRRKSESRCRPRVLQGDLEFAAAMLACSPAHEG